MWTGWATLQKIFFLFLSSRYTARERQNYVDMPLHWLFDDFLSDYSGRSDAILNKFHFMAMLKNLGNFSDLEKDTLGNH